MRLIRAVRELNEEHGHGIRVIALHTEEERHATFVRAADEAVVLRDTGAGIPYLDHGELGRALQVSRADAAWVGWGFVAEDPAFAELCASLGVTFIGPPADAMRLLGAKIEAKVLAEQTGVPVAPWSGGPVASLDDGLRHAATIGYPLIIKSRSGGGGRGIRIVRSEDELADALERTQVEAERTFGDPVIFMERLVEGGRHIEVQVIADAHGTVWAPGVRDCSIQRRNQKVIEEAPSPVIDDELRARMGAVAVRAAQSVGYVGAGTIEMLFDGASRSFYFLEMNTRLQVEHPITELVTGVDLVRWQIAVAGGARLPFEQAQIARRGAAIECRVYAEDSVKFLPSPGTITSLRVPGGPGIRDDSGVTTGSVISVHYDPMISKLCAWADTRGAAIDRMRRALGEYHVGGIKTNLAFHRRVMRNAAFIAGDYDTGFIERHKAALTQPAPDDETAALAAIAAAAEAARAGGGGASSDLDLSQTQPSPWRRRRDD
jgi:acetyl/propionyl-CoA carboxylase alpha subunit